MGLLFILIIPLAAAALSLVSADRRFAPAITIAGALAVLVLALKTAFTVIKAGEIIAIADWVSCNSLSALILLLVAFVSLTAAVFSWGYIEVHTGPDNVKKIQRYYIRFNLFVFSMLAVVLFSQVALVWVAVELTTLMSVFLVSFDNTRQALEAAWKYVVLTCMGAAFALLGILLLYWAMKGAGGKTFTWEELTAVSQGINPKILKTAFIFILIGFGTKVGLVPMHTWLPDAHSQAPSPVCALLSGVETTTILYVILRLLPILNVSPSIHASEWFLVSGLVSVGAAAFLLIQVKDYKRLFAFSTVEHMGIIMVAVGLGGSAAHLGATYQILSHAITKSLCFFAAGTTLLIVGTREISSVRGLIRTSPIAGGAFLIGGLAIAGAPPFAVFLSEFAILRAGIAGGHYIAITLLGIFILMAFAAVMFHVNRMVFGKPPEDMVKVALPKTAIISLTMALVPVIVLGLYIPDSLYKLLRLAAASLGR
ncbi:MAG: hydrogenase 4 subunit F [Deltaproteobacteria bacterium]|nr:hydrogenase 4 subunit F [Deltaproteobacteria bacterium]